MKIGYARVSNHNQSFEAQLDALTKAGCQKIYQEVATGAHSERPALYPMLENLSAGDVVVIWKLDRLGRSFPHLIALVGGASDVDTSLNASPKFHAIDK